MAQSYSVQTVPDVTRGGYCFSDGVGRISGGLREAVAGRLIRLGRCPPGCVPSALQIRYAGCKGMVALHPDLSGLQWYILLLVLLVCMAYKRLAT